MKLKPALTRFSRPAQHRKIEHLIEAELVENGPALYAKKRRRKGAIAAGLAFERLVAKRLAKLSAAWQELGIEHTICSGQWIYYKDLNGYGYAQPDFYIVLKDHVLLLEAKLTQTENAQAQMRELYIPLLENIYRKVIIPVQVCKVLTSNPGTALIPCPTQLLLTPKFGNWIWQCLR